MIPGQDLREADLAEKFQEAWDARRASFVLPGAEVLKALMFFAIIGLVLWGITAASDGVKSAQASGAAARTEQACLSMKQGREGEETNAAHDKEASANYPANLLPSFPEGV